MRRVHHSKLTISDVLEVLIAEYRLALVRRAHRRFEIDDLVARAKQRLDKEREDPTGKLRIRGKSSVHWLTTFRCRYR
jgi:hypothetical protein